MSAGSKKSSKAAKTPRAAKNSSGKQPLGRPFAPDILKTARNMVGGYQIIVEHDAGQWYGRGLELPHVYGDGATPAACIESTREALAATVAYLLEQGQAPPPPARQGKRTAQVNVRLTAEEKAILEATAHRRGFEGLSDFLRAAALESAR